MGWVRVDDSFYDHMKFSTVGPLGLATWVSGLAYANRNLTDGFIPARTARRIIDCDGIGIYTSGMGGRDAEAQDGVDELVATGLWDEVEGGYQIHDYLDFQPSAEKVRQERGKTAERQMKAREAKAQKRESQRESQRESRCDNGGGHGVSALAPNPNPNPTTEEPPPTPPKPSTALALVPDRSAAPTVVDRSPSSQVFDAWIESTGRTGRTQLDAKRRRLIDAALKGYPLDDVLDAVRGWRHSSHHRGENSSRTVYNDLELLLRDASHVERFRDLQRGKGLGPRTRPKSFGVLERRAAAHRAEGLA